MNFKNYASIFCLLFVGFFFNAEAQQRIVIKPTSGDMTLEMRDLLEKSDAKDLILDFKKGEYHFHSDYAVGKYCFITNHDNGYKKIIFPFEKFNSVEIQGNGSEFIFHGLTLPFVFDECEKVTMRDLKIDWDIPFTFQGEVVASNENHIDFKPQKEGFSWKFRNGKIYFPGIDGFNFSKLGSSLIFSADEKRVTNAALDHSSDPEKIEKLPGNIIRLHETRKYLPPVGSIVNFKGPKGENRYAPAIQVINSKNIHFENVVIYHAPGMGFLFEKTEDIVLKKCGVHLRDNTPRVISSTADATHFCNCKGDILIEDCRFENMLDDGTNVHGTYVAVDSILGTHSLLVELKHFQQSGFQFADIGDEIWFIKQPSPKRTVVNTISKITPLNDRFSKIEFTNKLPESIASGDLLENKTWNPTFTMRGCTIRDHRARNIVLKTPKKILIENNDFSSMMSSIFFRGESFYWFESGGVRDVLIKNNRFEYCASSSNGHAVMWVTPRLGKSFSQNDFFDQNIRFENNEIVNYSNRIVRAERVDGLTISGNKITHKTPPEDLGYNRDSNAPLFDFTNCRNVKVLDNSYEGNHPHFMKADSISKIGLQTKNNSGFAADVSVDVKVVLLAGQSNMAGCGSYDTLSVDLKNRVKKAAKNVQMSIGGKPPVPLTFTHSKYQENKLGFGNVFGPELFLGVILSEKYPNQKFLLIKRSQGGTALYGAWNPNWTAEKAAAVEREGFKRDLKLYELHHQDIQANLDRIKANGKSYEIVGMAWFQGENDAAKEIASRGYENNLKTLIAGYRTRLKVPEMPFIIGQINSTYGRFKEGPEMVRNAMIRVAESDPKVEIIRTSTDRSWSDFPKHSDNVHYNAEGQMRIGKAFANRLFQVQ